jgi:hypothetical protein
MMTESLSINEDNGVDTSCEEEEDGLEEDGVEEDMVGDETAAEGIIIAFNWLTMWSLFCSVIDESDCKA